MTLEERIAEALHYFFEADGRAPDATDHEAARAVIGVFPKADVSDETISWWMPPCSDADKAEAVSDLRREVIDPMAAAHAAEVERMRIGGGCDACHAEMSSLDAEVGALRAEVERLNRRLFPGQGHEYVNEVERQRAVIDTLTAAVKTAEARAEAAEADRDAYRARIDAIRVAIHRYDTMTVTADDAVCEIAAALGDA